MIVIVLSYCCLGWTGCDRNRDSEKLIFKNAGFAISPLDHAIEESRVVLAMFLPASGGFASNINVITQPYSGTLDEYIALSENKIGNDTVVFEYTEEMQTRPLHFYGKATLKTGLVYLTTATATDEQWKVLSNKLKACVDSFETTQTETKPKR